MPARKRGGRWVDLRQLKQQLRLAQVAQAFGLRIGLPVQYLADDRIFLARIPGLPPGLGFSG